ncbi:MAG: hypothetical protein A2X22_10660 [Bacteroidetes bacterium GWF2_49_14]|nr:MAG: hypothetical protein A2X22_10660 [Bacteroidetes bacterium GWF2_49_14]
MPEMRPLNLSRLVTILILFFASASLVAQSEDPNLRNHAIRVFLDCSRCDVDYIRREMPFVNYVRDWKEAQVHILVTRQSTGSGGIEYKINLIGQEEFLGIDDEVSYVSTPDATSDMVRSGYTRMMAIGLMKYVAKTPLAEYMNFRFDGEGAGVKEDKLVTDKWNSWVFDIRSTGELEEQESYSSLEMENDIEAEKVTPEWKIYFAGSYDGSLRKYRYDEEEYISRRTNYSIRHLLVNSLNDHWSLGGRAGISSSTYGNIRFATSLAPAIEYNIFPYSLSNRKQVRFQYRIGYGYNFYQDTTIYNKLEEGLFSHQLLASADFRQPWGNINISGQYSNYLHDWSKNSIRLWAGLYFRVFKGLSLSISGDAAFIHDQLSLQKEGATPEEVLLRQKQMATNYDYSLKVGFSYTFGSIYNNIVNSRFN